jgi:FkbM family methyltransferase
MGASGKAVTFEPVEDGFAQLVFNAKLTLLCVSFPFAQQHPIATEDWIFYSTKTLPIKGARPALSQTYVLPTAKTISVRSVCLDDYIQHGWHVPEFMKVDVEGGARLVLQGAQNLTAKHQPEIYLELLGPEEQSAVRDLLRLTIVH